MTTVLYRGSETIIYDGAPIKAMVSDPEEIPGPVKFASIEPGLLKKVVAIQKEDLSRRPREGDEVELSLTLEDTPSYWQVAGVVETWHEYKIHFERFTG